VLRDTTVMAFVATADPDRAMVFYRDVLGLRLVADERYALVFAAGGSMLRIQKVRDLKPQPFTALGWEVDDIAGAVDELAGRGATMLRVDGIPQDTRGIWDTGEGAKVCWFRDPDGNTLSLTEFAGPG
jgi:catechol 2,3-dioxygenase-like lactoylglutathione lyase family enzyme